MNLKKIIDNNLKFIKKNTNTCVFFLFFAIWIWMLTQHLCIGMYYDDYGNAALAYGYVVDGVHGTDFKIADIIEWAKWIYLNWGGRLLYACVILIPLLKNGITLYMVLQSMIIIAILYTMYKIICSYLNKKHSIGVVIMLAVMYGLLNREMQVNGTYWASASVLYIWPLLPLFITIFEYNKVCEDIAQNKKINWKKVYVIETLGIMWVTLSQEQYGVALIAFFVIYIVCHHITNYKKYIKWDMFCVIWSVLTYLIMFAAPGNFVRLDTNDEFSKLSFWGKIQRNFPLIIDMFYNESFKEYNILIIIATIMMIICLLKKSKKEVVDIIIAISTAIIDSAMFYGIETGADKSIVRIVCFLFLVNTAIVGLRYFGIKKKLEFNAIIIMSAVSAFCLLMSPTISHRSFLCYIFGVSIVVVTVFFEFYYSLNKNDVINIMAKAATILILCLFVQKAFINSKDILIGYYENKHAIEYNTEKLENKIINANNQIILMEYPTMYRTLMPCDEGYEYIEYWMREYYDIPNDVQLRWVNEKNIDSYIQTVDMIFDVKYNSISGENDNGKFIDSKGIFHVYNPLQEQVNVVFNCKINQLPEGYSIILDNEKTYRVNDGTVYIYYDMKLNSGDNIIYYNIENERGEIPDEIKKIGEIVSCNVKLR